MTEVILTTIVAPLIATLALFVRGWIQTNLGPQRYNTVLGLARTVVSAAEQFGQDHDLTGKAKYDYAEDALVKLAARIGVKLKPAEANAFIHATLMELQTLVVDTPEQDVAVA